MAIAFNRVQLCMYLVNGGYRVLPAKVTLFGSDNSFSIDPDAPPALLSGGPPILPATANPFYLVPGTSTGAGGVNEAVLHFNKRLLGSWVPNFNACQEIQLDMDVGAAQQPMALIVEICYCGEISLSSFKKLLKRVLNVAAQSFQIVLIRAWKALHELLDLPEIVVHLPHKKEVGLEVKDSQQLTDNGGHKGAGFKPSLVQEERDYS